MLLAVVPELAGRGGVGRQAVISIPALPSDIVVRRRILLCSFNALSIE